VAQLNLYVPDEVAKELKQHAAAEGKSLSRYVLDRLQESTSQIPAFGPDFWAHLKRLGPVSDDFVAPKRPGPGALKDISLD